MVSEQNPLNMRFPVMPGPPNCGELANFAALPPASEVEAASLGRTLASIGSMDPHENS